MNLKSELREALLLTKDPADLDEVVATVLRVLHGQDWHGPSDCEDCDEPHCSDHANDGDLLLEAVQMLHGQAHNGPGDTFTAERCHREPCRTAASAPTHDAGSAFTPGSRVA